MTLMLQFLFVNHANLHSVLTVVDTRRTDESVRLLEIGFPKVHFGLKSSRLSVLSFSSLGG